MREPKVFQWPISCSLPFWLLCSSSTPYRAFPRETTAQPKWPLLGSLYLSLALSPAVAPPFKVLQSLFIESSSFPGAGPSSRPGKPPLHLSLWASCYVLAVSQAGTSLSWL